MSNLCPLYSGHISCAHPNVHLVFVMTGTLTAIRGTRQRNPSQNKTSFSCVSVCLPSWPPTSWTVTVANETQSVLTVPGEINTLYAVMLTHRHAHNVLHHRMLSKEPASKSGWVITAFSVDAAEVVHSSHHAIFNRIIGESSQPNSIPIFMILHGTPIYINAGLEREREHLHALFLPCLEKDDDFQEPHLTELRISLSFVSIKINQFICRHTLFTCLSFITLRALCHCCITRGLTIKHLLWAALKR